MNESKFDGTLLGLIGVRIVSFFITAFTLGIGVPWAVTYRQKWLIKHQTIDGKQLVFDGTGGQLFGNYIKWFLLAIITVGIYGLWIPLKIQSWVTKHTHFETKQISLEEFEEKNAKPHITQPIETRSKNTTMLLIVGLAFLVFSSLSTFVTFIQFIVAAIRFGTFPFHPFVLIMVFFLVIMIIVYILSLRNSNKKMLIVNTIVQVIGFVLYSVFSINFRYNDRFVFLIINILMMMIPSLMAILALSSETKKENQEKEKNFLQ